MSTVALAAPLDSPKILPYGEKATRFWRRAPKDDTRITILEGAVRSAKTWACIPKFFALCAYQVAGLKVLFGVSKQTVKHNMLNDIFDIVGEGNYSYNQQSGELEVLGSKWITIGAKDEGSEKYLRGKTIGVALGDELTLLPESFMLMLLNRLSPPGARLYGTTNPDSPYHYLRTRIIDWPAFKLRGDITVIHFTLEDNPNLTEEYKNYVKAAYSGLFKLRYIDGLWVVAEGSIYKDCWSDELLYDDDTVPSNLRGPDGHVDRYVAVDYGTAHPQVYLDMIDDGDTVWVDREYIWDSVVEMRQKTDAEYGDDLELFLKDAPDAITIIPPECASFETEVAQRGIWNCTADNNVMDGIRAVSTMMKRGKLRVHKRCERLRAEIPVHAWDQKKALRGVEEPIKQRDDSCDALRYGIKTRIPDWRLALN